MKIKGLIDRLWPSRRKKETSDLGLQLLSCVRLIDAQVSYISALEAEKTRREEQNTRLEEQNKKQYKTIEENLKSLEILQKNQTSLLARNTEFSNRIEQLESENAQLKSIQPKKNGRKKKYTEDMVLSCLDNEYSSYTSAKSLAEICTRKYGMSSSTRLRLITSLIQRNVILRNGNGWYCVRLNHLT